jgi:hypothetical protein
VNSLIFFYLLIHPKDGYCGVHENSGTASGYSVAKFQKLNLNISHEISFLKHTAAILGHAKNMFNTSKNDSFPKTTNQH